MKMDEGDVDFENAITDLTSELTVYEFQFTEGTRFIKPGERR